MTDRQTTPTAYGDVEYETVECDSCGNDVLKKDASTFVVGECTSQRDRYTGKQFRFKDSDCATGWICPYCRDEGGIIGTPSVTDVRALWLSIDQEGRFMIKLFAAISAILVFVVSLSTVLEAIA